MTVWQALQEGYTCIEQFHHNVCGVMVMISDGRWLNIEELDKVSFLIFREVELA